MKRTIRIISRNVERGTMQLVRIRKAFTADGRNMTDSQTMHCKLTTTGPLKGLYVSRYGHAYTYDGKEQV